MSFIKKPKTIENIQKLENAQQHISEHKQIYIAAGGGIVAGIVVARLFTKSHVKVTVNVTAVTK